MFLVPAIVGTAVISAFYLMIMYFNDNRFTPGEMAGMAVCAAVIAVLSAAASAARWESKASEASALPEIWSGGTGIFPVPPDLFVYFPPLPAIFLHKVLRPIPSRLAAAD